MRLYRKDEGFTLIELMVVVLIIGILVAIAIPVFNSAKANAQEKSCFANQRTIDGASNTYEAETGLKAADVAALVTGGYLKTAPECPLAQAMTYALDANGMCTTTCTHGAYQ